MRVWRRSESSGHGVPAARRPWVSGLCSVGRGRHFNQVFFSMNNRTVSPPQVIVVVVLALGIAALLNYLKKQRLGAPTGTRNARLDRRSVERRAS